MSANLEAEKKALVECYHLASRKKDADAAFEDLGPIHTQHNPTVADDFEGWRAMVGWLVEHWDIPRPILETAANFQHDVLSDLWIEP